MQIHSRQTLPLFALLGLLSALPAQGQSSSSQPMPPSNARAATSLTTLQGSGGGFGFQGSTNYEGGWWEFERTSGLLMEEIMTNLGHGQSIDQIHTSFGPIELNHNHRGWAMPSEVGPWSHGYEGVVLGSGIFQEINLTFPAGTRAFDTYIQPFVEGAYHFGVAATFSDGSTVEFNVNTVNPGGARQLGFYCVPGVSLTHVAFTGGLLWSVLLPR